VKAAQLLSRTARRVRGRRGGGSDGGGTQS